LKAMFGVAWIGSDKEFDASFQHKARLNTNPSRLAVTGKRFAAAVAAGQRHPCPRANRG